jgi:hypothetical protein
MPRAHNKRSLTIARHRTSVSLEDEFWDALNDVCSIEGKSVAGADRRNRPEAERAAKAGSPVSRPRSVLYVLERARSSR